MSIFFDFFFGSTVTREQLGHLGGNPRFRPPAPPLPAGHVDNNGVPITAEMWADYENAGKR